MRFLCKILLAVIIFLTLIITLISIFFLLFNFLVSTFCNITHEFASITDFSPYFSTTESQLVRLANTCIG